MIGNLYILNYVSQIMRTIHLCKWRFICFKSIGCSIHNYECLGLQCFPRIWWDQFTVIVSNNVNNILNPAQFDWQTFLDCLVMTNFCPTFDTLFLRSKKRETLIKSQIFTYWLEMENVSMKWYKYKHWYVLFAVRFQRDMFLSIWSKCSPLNVFLRQSEMRVLIKYWRPCLELNVLLDLVSIDW